ncbi:hypothetical protein D8W71_22215 [Rhodococcus sp. P1Y]|nr:hypothetical protein D8W71_22215 [Rhodococcus sp. P1Y]
MRFRLSHLRDGIAATRAKADPLILDSHPYHAPRGQRTDYSPSRPNESSKRRCNFPLLARIRIGSLSYLRLILLTTPLTL